MASRGNGSDADAEAARAIDRQMRELRERVQQGGVMEYLNPLGTSGRKDVNKVFLASTIRSVDTHNRRHEEEKCWKARELDERIRDRHRRRSRSFSPGRRHRHSHRTRSRSRSRDRDSRSCRDRSRSHDSHRLSRVAESSEKSVADAEREFWAAKKAEKTRKMWENIYAGTTSVMVSNAPDFSAEESDDEDERIDKKKSTHKTGKERAEDKNKEKLDGYDIDDMQRKKDKRDKKDKKAKKDKKVKKDKRKKSKKTESK